MPVTPYNRTAGYATMAGMNRLCLPIGLLGLVVAMLLPGCQAKHTSPENEVRALIYGAVAAAEQKNIGKLSDSISRKYADDQGRNKRAVENLLRLHFLRNESVHLYAHIQSVTLAQPDLVQASVLVAMAGVPIASAQDLPALIADLHRFEIDFAHEGRVWRVQRATWRRAELGEFLSP